MNARADFHFACFETLGYFNHLWVFPRNRSLQGCKRLCRPAPICEYIMLIFQGPLKLWKLSLDSQNKALLCQNQASLRICHPEDPPF